MIVPIALAFVMAAQQSAPPVAPSKPMGTFDEGPGSNSHPLKSVGIRGTIDAGGYAASAEVKTQTEFFQQLVKLQLKVLRSAWNPNDLCSAANALRQEGIRLLTRGEFESAETSFENLLRGDDDPKTHQLLGLAYEGAGQLSAAAEQFSTAAGKQPSDVTAAVAYAGALLLEGNVERAERVSSAAAANKSGTIWLARLSLGAAFFQRGNVTQALTLFGEAASQHPAEDLPFEFMAVALRSADAAALTSAVDLLNRLALDSKKGSAHYALACALAAASAITTANHAGDEGAIERELKQAVKLDPSLGDAYLRLGAINASRGDLAAATTEYGDAVKADPSRAEAHYRLGQAYARSEKVQQAKQELEIYEQLRAKQKSDIESGKVPIRLPDTMPCP